MSEKLTHEIFIERMKEVNPKIKILGRFENKSKHILVECLDCGHTWDVVPRSLLKGHGCYPCNIKRVSNARIKTHEQFELELKEINPDIILIGKYTKAQNRILVECAKCHKRWESKACSLLTNRGCRECRTKEGSDKQRKSTEDFIEELSKVNPTLEVKGEYISRQHPIDIECRICKHRWTPLAGNVIYGSQCPECSKKFSGEKRRKDPDKFVSDLKSANPMITVIGVYESSNTPLQVKCEKCSHIWFANPANLLSGAGCPECTRSKGEDRISHYLEDNGIIFEQQKKFDELLGVKGGKLSYDFYIPSINMLIEYNGKQHYKPISYFGGIDSFEKQQEHDRRKREYAKLHDYNLIEIPYYDFDNIETILTSYISKAA